MKEQPDIATIQKAAKGDTDAFRMLLGKYQGFVYSLASRFISDKAEIDDITQEVFIRLWKNLATYKPEVKFTTWLYRIVVNKCLDYLKSREFKTGMDTCSVEGAVIAAPESPDRILIDTEFYELVIKYSDVLPDKQRTVFILRDIEGLSLDEIAEILRMNAGSVKSNLYYARLRLADLLKVHYEEKERNIYDV